jgi:hypothetical protein
VSERDPSQAEIDQVEPEVYAPMEVPVKVEGPIRAQLLPATAFTATTRALTATEAIKVASRDVRRSRVVLIASATVWIGVNQMQAKQNVGGSLPANVPVEMRHTEDIYAIADAATPTLTVIEEFWTD